MYGVLIVFKAKKLYQKNRLLSLDEAKAELATTNARLSGARGRNQKAWLLPADKVEAVADLALLTRDQIVDFLDKEAIALK